MGKKDTPVQPTAPDPAATAAAQSQTNKAAAIAQANLNRIDQVTPQGSLTYKQIGTNDDGTPQYQQTQSLSPDEQKKYDLSNQVATSLDGLAVDNIAKVGATQATPFNYDNMTPLQTSVTAGTLPQVGQLSGIANAGPIQNSLDYSKLTALPGTSDFSADAKATQDSVYAQAASRLDPQWTNNDSDFKSQMAAQGISENSDAYRRAQTNEANAKNDAYNQATYSAQQAGSAEQSRLFGLAMDARQQGQNEVDTQGNFANSAQGQQFQQNAATATMANANEATTFGQQGQDQSTAFNQDQANLATNNAARQQQEQEAAYLRNLPLNDIAALLGTGSGVSEPTFSPVSQVGVAAPDMMGMTSSNYNAAMQQYNQQMQSQSNMLGSIFGAAGTIGSALVGSDIRFKEDIKRIGTLANGIATYAFKYIGEKAQRFGVMAQEVVGVMPDAVVRDADGFMYVDYRKVYG